MYIKDSRERMKLLYFKSKWRYRNERMNDEFNDEINLGNAKREYLFKEKGLKKSIS